MSSSTARGAASAAPLKPSQRRKRGATPTFGGRESIAFSVDVLNWVRTLIRAGYARDQIVQLSRTAEDFPGDRPLSNGSLAICRAAIYHLEEQGARFPLAAHGGALRRSRNPFGKRSNERGKQLAAARRSQESTALLFTAYEITKVCGLIYGLRVEDADLDELTLQALADVQEDLLYLDVWGDRMVREIEARMGDEELRRKVAALRSKTVANGATREEAETAQAAADRLERRLAMRLSQ